MRPPLWLLTGARQAGKTTLCSRLADLAREKGWDVAGLLSLAVFKDEAKTGIVVQALRGGETRLLAAAEPAPGLTLAQGRWRFDQTAIDWGNKMLEDSLPCDLLIVDEIGPLELVSAQGWTAALPVLRSKDYRVGIVVVRPELIEAACTRLPIHAVLTLPLPGECDVTCLLAGA